jgi:hypothetical protein
VRLALALIAILSLLAFGTWIARRRAHERAHAASAHAPIDSVSTLGPFEAYQRALALGQRLRFVESLPYFARAMNDPPNAWQPYAAYGMALFHATHQVRSHRGWPEPVIRSSRERVAMVIEALSRLRRAEELAADPKDRAYVIMQSKQQLVAWGFDWDAYTEWSRAEKLDPSLGPPDHDLEGRLRGRATPDDQR